jgi:hypothetical protein
MTVVGYSRREGPGSEPVARAAVPPQLEVAGAHRLLVGRGPGGAEARLTIDAGPLAGSLIHLREGAGGIEAAVSSQVASTRQILVAAMDQVASRLRDRGHALKVQVQAERDRRSGTGAESFPSSEASVNADGNWTIIDG